MIPVGYLAKRISKAPDWLKAAGSDDVYSVSSCVSEDFADYIEFWKHNGYWLFDSPEAIQSVANENSISLQGTQLFFYESYEKEFIGDQWREFCREPSIPTNIVLPGEKSLEGYDVVTFQAGNSPECSPLSCNGLAEELQTNLHCLFGDFEQAKSALDHGKFMGCEEGPYRIFAVYSVSWPDL